MKEYFKKLNLLHRNNQQGLWVKYHTNQQILSYKRMHINDEILGPQFPENCKETKFTNANFIW